MKRKRLIKWAVVLGIVILLLFLPLPGLPFALHEFIGVLLFYYFDAELPWSTLTIPSEGKIAFLAYTPLDRDTGTLKIVDEIGRVVSTFHDVRIVGPIDWSINSIAFGGPRGIYITSLRGEVRNLIKFSSSFETVKLKFSPRGDKVVFLGTFHNKTGSFPTGGMPAYYMYVVDIKGNILAKVEIVSSAVEFSWSEGGTKIAFDNYDGQTWNIYVLDLLTGKIEKIAERGKRPIWVREGIIFESFYGDRGFYLVGDERKIIENRSVIATFIWPSTKTPAVVSLHQLWINNTSLFKIAEFPVVELPKESKFLENVEEVAEVDKERKTYIFTVSVCEKGEGGSCVTFYKEIYLLMGSNLTRLGRGRICYFALRP